MSSLSLRRVSKTLGGRAILDAIDLEVPAGELLVVLGSSGCGKSTLLRVIAGLEAPSEGQVWIGDADVTARSPAQRGVSMVFQSYALYPHLTVAQNIGFPLRIAGLGKAEIVARVADIARLLGLEAMLDRRPRALSGGERQRVSIGRALVRDPAVLLLDEPLSNLDAGLRAQLRHEFARLHARLGNTMVYVTHDQLEAMTLANRIVVLAEGRIAQVGAPLELYRRPASILVATTIGSPRINFLPVTILPDAKVALPAGARVSVAARVPAERIGAPATLGIRPEHLAIDSAGALGGPVEMFERLGPLSFVYLGAGDGALVAQLPADQSVTLGETVRYGFAAEDALLFDEQGIAYPPLSP